MNNRILVVFNKSTGELVFTQTNATEQYSCLVEEVADNMEVIGVDIENNRCILADRLATTEEKEKLKKELEILTNNLAATENENSDLTDRVIDLTAENLLYKMEE